MTSSISQVQTSAFKKHDIIYLYIVHQPCWNILKWVCALLYGYVCNRSASAFQSLLPIYTGIYIYIYICSAVYFLVHCAHLIALSMSFYYISLEKWDLNSLLLVFTTTVIKSPHMPLLSRSTPARRGQNISR